MWIFTSFYRSLFDIAWIREQRGRIGRAFGYGLIFLTVIYGMRLIQPAFFIVPRAIETVETEFVKNTPDFTATWQNEKLSITGLPQPYVVEKTFDGEKMRVVIDTVSTSTPAIESFIKDRDTEGVILVTRDNFSFYNPEDKQTQIESFAGMTDETVTKADIAGIITKIKSFSPWISVGLLVVGIVLFIIGKLIGVLFLSLLVFIVARVRKFGWTYKEVLASSLYAMTLPTLIATTGLWLGVPLSTLGTVSFLVLMYLTVAGFDSTVKKA